MRAASFLTLNEITKAIAKSGAVMPRTVADAHCGAGSCTGKQCACGCVKCGMTRRLARAAKGVEVKHARPRSVAVAHAKAAETRDPAVEAGRS